MHRVGDNSMIRIGTMFGMRGYFAVMYDEDGPIQSSPLSFRTIEGAMKDALAWARGEQLPVDFDKRTEEILPRKIGR